MPNHHLSFDPVEMFGLGMQFRLGPGDALFLSIFIYEGPNRPLRGFINVQRNDLTTAAGELLCDFERAF